MPARVAMMVAVVLATVALSPISPPILGVGGVTRRRGDGMVIAPVVSGTLVIEASWGITILNCFVLTIWVSAARGIVVTPKSPTGGTGRG